MARDIDGLSGEELNVFVADSLGASADSYDYAFQKIIADEDIDGSGDRNPCNELRAIAKLIVFELAAGNETLPERVLSSLEGLLVRSRDSDAYQSITGSLLITCFIADLHIAMQEFDERYDQIRYQLYMKMGKETRILCDPGRSLS